jgi:hypothetical protein
MPRPAFLLQPFGRKTAPLWSSVPTIEARRALLRGTQSVGSVTAKVVGRGTLPDLFFVGDPALRGVSDRLAAALRPFTGVRFTPLQIEGHTERRWVLTVDGRCGEVDFRRSAVIGRLTTFLQLQGLALTSMDADADLSMPANYDAIRRGSFKNVAVVPLADFRIDLTPEMIESDSPPLGRVT